MAYEVTSVDLYRTTQDPRNDPRIELASLRDGMDITVQRGPQNARWIQLEMEKSNPARHCGYSLSTQLINARVRQTAADEVGEADVKVGKHRWLRGSVYCLPAGTTLPPDFNGIQDGHQHHTVFPTAQVPVVFLANVLYYNLAIRDLPWQQVDGDFLIKANADVPEFEDGMDPDAYDLVLALHQAFDLVDDAADTDEAIDLQSRIIEAGFPPASQIEPELMSRCRRVLLKAGIEVLGLPDLVTSESKMRFAHAHHDFHRRPRCSKRGQRVP